MQHHPPLPPSYDEAAGDEAAEAVLGGGALPAVVVGGQLDEVGLGGGGGPFHEGVECVEDCGPQENDSGAVRLGKAGWEEAARVAVSLLHDFSSREKDTQVQAHGFDAESESAAEFTEGGSGIRLDVLMDGAPVAVA